MSKSLQAKETMERRISDKTLPKEKEDPILDYAAYPNELTKEKKRTVRKIAGTLILESREVYLQRKNRSYQIPDADPENPKKKKKNLEKSC